MQNFKDEIAVYIEKSKKKSKLNKSETAEVIALLYGLLVEDNTNIGYVVNALVELPYTITAVFFENVFPTLVEQNKTDFINAFLHADKIYKNAANFGINRNLIIVNALLRAEGDYDHLHTILKYCTKQTYGKDGGKKAGELLSKICFADTKDKLFLLDYSTWQENELRSFSSWVYIAIATTNDIKVLAAYNAFIETYNLSEYKTSKIGIDMAPISYEATAQPRGLGITENPKISNKPNEKIIGLVSDLQSEVSKILNERMKQVKEFEEIKVQLNQANIEKADFSMQLSEARRKSEQLQIEIISKEQQISDDENRITELNERLKNAFNADKAQQNQELLSLKNDLIKRLKLDYENFKKLASKEPNLQYYEALVETVDSMFETLRKKGIAFNNNYEE